MLPREAAKQGAGFIGHGDDAVTINIINAEEHFTELFDTLCANMLRDGVIDGCSVFQLNAASGDLLAQSVARGGSTRLFAFGRNEIHQIMDMDDIAAGKDAGRHGLHVLVNDGAVGAAVHGDPCCAGQFIFRNKADRE